VWSPDITLGHSNREDVFWGLELYHAPEVSAVAPDMSPERSSREHVTGVS